jgi:hypothetical protein
LPGRVRSGSVRTVSGPAALEALNLPLEALGLVVADEPQAGLGLAAARGFEVEDGDAEDALE